MTSFSVLIALEFEVNTLVFQEDNTAVLVNKKMEIGGKDQPWTTNF